MSSHSLTYLVLVSLSLWRRRGPPFDTDTGLNFQDHYLTFATYRAKPSVESFDDFVRGDKATQDAVFAQWNINGTGPLATNGIDAGVKVRPTEAELDVMDRSVAYSYQYRNTC